MGHTNDFAIARDLRTDQGPAPVPTINPQITVGSGRHVEAAQIVMGLAGDLNTDKIELPGFPDIVVSIHRALSDESSSTRDVVRLVGSEPTLAARLLKLANSAAFNKSGREVSDLRMAIGSLGFNLVRSQATAFAMRQMEQLEWLKPIRPALADIWKTSNGVAALCYAVGRQVPGVQGDEAMSAGLFHLLGKLYLFAKARKQSIDPREIADWERALNEWHATIARTILDHWRVPERIAEAVERQNAIFETDNSDLTMLTRILCACKLHYRLRRPNAVPEPEAEAALARVRLNGLPFAEVVAAAQAESAALESALG